MRSRLKVFAGSSNPRLAESVCRHLGLSLGKALVTRFSDGEVRVEIGENVRGVDAYVVQSTCRPVHDHLMELLLMVDALKRASAERINAVIPYYGYGRRDQKDKPRVPITAKVVANLLSAAGVDRVVSCSLHAGQIQGFFRLPVDDIPGHCFFMNEIQKGMTQDSVVVAPDAAGVARARVLAEKLVLPLAIIHQERETGQREPVVVGDVRGRSVLIYDDMVDTGTKVCAAAQAVKVFGAREASAFCVHGVLSSGAVERIEASPLRRLVVTDTVPLASQAAASSKITAVSVAPLLAQVMDHIHRDESVSRLFA
ncbi:MAG: ribose-phosphate pyrophosphokinase [Desulfosoma sp.]|uniref:ribose-phosphate pyrophosphokinase n=1 Tax=Desulfosoma sp. TaxID=2603217 RepID=UPI00404A989C